MNIAVMSQNFPNYISGGRLYPWYLGYSLAFRGHNVKLVTDEMPIFKDEFKGFYNENNVEIIVDKGFCSKKIRRIKDTDVFIGSPIMGADYATVLAEILRKRSAVLCYEPHNWLSGSIKNNVESNSNYWEDYIKAAKKCDVFCCNAKIPQKYAKEWIPDIKEKITFCYNGINSVIADKIEIVEKEKRENSCVYVGRIDEHKCVYDIPRILGKSSIDIDKIYCVCGYVSGNDKVKFENLCKKFNINVIWKIGATSYEKFEIISKSMFMINTTRFEGFGIPPAESLYLKTPVFLYKLDIFEEVYQEYPHYMDINSIENSAKILSDVYNDSLFNDMEHAKEYVSSFASIESFAYNFEKNVIAKIFDSVCGEERKEIKSTKFKSKKSISVVIPVRKANDAYLGEFINSLKSQTHEDFECVFVDDGMDKSNKKLIEENMDDLSYSFVEHGGNKGIPRSINDGVTASKNEIVAFADYDDILEDRALEYIAYAFDCDDCDIVYTNEYRIDSHGKIIEEVKKPDWSVELLMQCQYINHLTAYKKEFIEKILPCKDKYRHSWDYSLLLDSVKHSPVVGHVPYSLYRWRSHNDNFGRELGGLLAEEESSELIEKFIKERGWSSKLSVRHLLMGKNEIIHKVRKKQKVLCIIPFVNFSMVNNAIESLKRKTIYGEKYYDIALIYHNKNSEHDSRVTKFFNKKVKYVFELGGEFNFCSFNNYVFDEVGFKYDKIVLMNDDIMVGNRWLTELISMFDYRWKDVGVVGCKLLYPNHENNFLSNFPNHWLCDNSKIQHAGAPLLRDKGVSHIYKNKENCLFAANYIKEVDSVTFGLVAIDKECYQDVRLNEEYSCDYNDMEFCIRASQKGWRIVYNPWCVAFHFETITRKREGNAGKVSDQVRFRKEYRNVLDTKIMYRDMINIERNGL